jgi:thioredoxin 1
MKEILHFTADWCMPCKRIKPVVEEYVGNNPDVIYKPIDVDVDFAIAKNYNIMSIPTLVILKDGIEFSRHTGLANYDKINSLVNG